MNHTIACESRQFLYEAQKSLYDVTWPHHCTKCRCRGVDEWDENQSPIGSGMYWPEHFCEPCDGCWSDGFCPRCGFQVWDEWELALDDWSGLICPVCEWKEGTAGEPDFECWCWEDEIDREQQEALNGPGN